MTSTITHSDHSVAVYETHDQAEAAIKTLVASGHEIKHLSIIGVNFANEEHPVGFVNTGDRMMFWGKLGAFWGAIWGMLFGSAMLVFPGLGAVMFAGWIVSALEGAVLGGAAAALGGALVGIGIPKDSVVKYESELKAGRFLVMIHGDETEIANAKNQLGTTPAISVESYSTKQPAGVA